MRVKAGQGGSGLPAFGQLLEALLVRLGARALARLKQAGAIKKAASCRRGRRRARKGRSVNCVANLPLAGARFGLPVVFAGLADLGTPAITCGFNLDDVA